jgi:hypothetical protein
MNTVGQWVHQHNLLLLCAAVVAGTGVLLAFRWRSLRLWLAWLSLAGISLATLLTLRTPAASLAEHRPAADVEAVPFAATDHESIVSSWTTEYSQPDLESVEAIEKLIASGGEATLVEVYADYGLY